jgi:hypothetical protein
LLEAACRGGFAARGFVYLNVGLIALLSALGLAPKASGAVEAFEAWAAWPLGIVLLWLIGLGLYGFAAWRALQSVLDADRQGTSPKAIASRIGQAVSGLVYGGMAISVFGVIDALEDLRELEDQADTRASIQALLDMPMGIMLVTSVGVFILACGVGNIVQAFYRDFCARLVCSEPMARRAALLGRIGYAARGIVFLPAGAFMVLAGLHARSAEVKSTGAALDWLKAQPFGPLLLGVTALGLIAFGAFAFVEARFRTLGVVSDANAPGVVSQAAG